MKRVQWRWPPAAILATHTALAAASNLVAFWVLAYDAVAPPDWRLSLRWLSWLLAMRALSFAGFRLHQEVWAYTGLAELRAIAHSVLASSIAFYAVVQWLFAATEYRLSIVVLDSVLLICLMTAVQMSKSMVRDLRHARPSKRALIWGAGDTGEMLVRDMRRNRKYHYEPVGFIDDNAGKTGSRIHGVPVLGTRDRLGPIISRTRPDEIILAMSDVDPATTRAIVQALAPFDVRLRSMPSVHEVVNSKDVVRQLRELAVEDLLPRARFNSSGAEIGELVGGKCVLVTGAGGSIGSELCHQIAAAGPSRLILFERAENSLYTLINELADRPHHCVIHPVIGDVTDQRRLDDVLTAYRPQIVLHAAAHKHVPLMEMNPCEAVKNNVRGTRMVAEASAHHRVERFTMVSTDKAVNPASVMGTSKRVAELIVQDIARRSRATNFTTVRFGNVLGSSGSVVPRFLDQIKAGGPVTVTDPQMRRYFMLIPEAVHLVLQTAARGANGAIYVLEMGEQVGLVELARSLIKLCGLVPERDIGITFVGLRPGEKLFEELTSADEIASPSAMPHILEVRRRTDCAPARVTTQEIAALEALADSGDAVAVVRELQRLVPSFHSTLKHSAA